MSDVLAISWSDEAGKHFQVDDADTNIHWFIVTCLSDFDKYIVMYLYLRYACTDSIFIITILTAYSGCVSFDTCI